MQHFTNLGHKGTTKNAHLQESEHNFQKKDRFIYLQTIFLKVLRANWKMSRISRT
jgi:hypothetical protein